MRSYLGKVRFVELINSLPAGLGSGEYSHHPPAFDRSISVDSGLGTGRDVY